MLLGLLKVYGGSAGAGAGASAGAAEGQGRLVQGNVGNVSRPHLDPGIEVLRIEVFHRLISDCCNK